MNLAKILEDHELWLKSGGDAGKRVELIGASLCQVVLPGHRRNLSRSIMRRCDLRSANLHAVDLSDSDLSGSDLRRADVRWSFLTGADLSGCKLGGADFTGAYLEGCNLSGANLRFAVLPHSTLLLPEHHIVWWGDQLAIDGHQYSLDQWADLSDIDLSPGLFRWWRTWKDVIFQAVEASKGAYQ